MSLKPKVAHTISDQIPSVFVDSYLHKFLTAYYQFLEQQGVDGALYYLRNAVEIKDIDTAPDYIVKQVVYSILNNYKQLNVEPRLLVKNLREIFANKGNERSYKFLMQALFGTDAELSWGRDKVFKTSTFDYEQRATMIIDVSGIDTDGSPFQLDGNIIFKEKSSTTSTASAVVDGTSLVTKNGKTLLKLDIVPHTIHGTYSVGDVVSCECRNNGKFLATVAGQHGDLDILNSGMLYKVGDMLRFIGHDGSGYVTETTSGPIDDVLIIDSGLGYSKNDSIHVDHELGSGLECRIEAVDGYGASARPRMRLEEIHIEHGGYNYQVGDIITVNCGDTFTSVVQEVSSSDIVENIKVINKGTGYIGTRIAFYNEEAGVYSNVQFLSENLSQLSGITKLSKQYSLSSSGKAVVNGVGASVWIKTITAGVVTEVGYSSGINYISPVINIKGKNNLSLTTQIGLNANYGINSVTIQKSSTNFVSVTDTVDITTGNKFFTTTTPSKYQVGFGVKIGSWHAMVTNVLGNQISVNVASTITHSAAATVINQAALDVVDGKGTGAIVVPMYNSGRVTKLSIPSFMTYTIDRTQTSGGSGYGLQVRPFFNVYSIDVDNPGSQYAESILRYDTVTIGEGATTFSVLDSTRYEVGAQIKYDIYTTYVTSILGSTITIDQASPITYTGKISIKLFASATTVQITDGHGIGAELSFVIDDGVIGNINLAAGTPGSGYSWIKIRDDVNNVGSGASIVGTISSSGQLVAVKILDGGHDYAPGDFFVVEGDGTGATIPWSAITLRNEAIRKVIVRNGGVGYYNDCNLIVEHVGFNVGTPAELNVNLYPEDSINVGKVESVTVVSGGTGYDANNIKLYISGSGYGATAYASVVGGVITSVTVADHGFGYKSASCKVVRGIDAKFKVNVIDGVIASVDVNDPGSGYGENIQPEYNIAPDAFWYPPEPGIMEYMFPMVDFYRLFPEPIGISRVATATCNISKGTVKSVDIAHPGEGYYNFDGPCKVVVNGKGTGAKVFPIIDRWTVGDDNLPLRRIKEVQILEEGSGYDDHTTITVFRNKCPGGIEAQLTPVVVGGKLVSVIVDEPGSGYYTGTEIYVKGNGTGATVNASINSGIRDVTFEQFSYAPVVKPQCIVQDITGTGAIINAVWDEDRLIGFDVVNPGSNYIAPVVTIGDIHNNGKMFRANIYGSLTDINVINGGSQYTNADIVILCDSGSSASATAVFSTLREIESVSVHNHGYRYGRVPKVTFTDHSKSGRISKVKILDRGTGYFRLPKLVAKSNTATRPALLVAYGKNVGGVSKVQLTDFGVDVDSDTIVAGSMNIINREINQYILGEPVLNNDITYTAKDYSDGPHGQLSEIDNSVAYLKIKLPPMKVALETENGDSLLGDIGEILIEASDDFGKNWKTAYSKTSLDPVIVDRFEGKFKPTAIVHHAAKLKTSNSILGSGIKFINSRNIQDYAYTVKAGVDIKFWRDIVTQLIHPAGYAMFGEISEQTFIKRSVKAIAKDDIGFIQDIIWLFINLSDADSIAKTPLLLDKIHAWMTVEWNKVIELIMTNDKFMTILHNIFFDLSASYVPYTSVKWDRYAGRKTNNIEDIIGYGFKAWYPYENFGNLTNLDGYTTDQYWSLANHSISHYLDMTPTEYLAQSGKTNLLRDSFVLTKTVI